MLLSYTIYNESVQTRIFSQFEKKRIKINVKQE